MSSSWSWPRVLLPRWGSARRPPTRTCPSQLPTGCEPTASSSMLDDDAISARRRVKSAPELAGTRRAQIAAEAGMSAAAGAATAVGPRRRPAQARRRGPDGRGRSRGGPDVCQAHGAPAPPDIIVSSPWSGYVHDPGSGPLPADLPIVIDLWPATRRRDAGRT